MRFIKLSLAAPLVLLAAMGCSDDGIDSSSFADQVEQKLSALDDRIKALSAELQGDDVKAEYHEQMANLTEQREALANKLEKISDVGADAWDEFKQDVESSYDALAESLDDLSDRISDRS